MKCNSNNLLLILTLTLTITDTVTPYFIRPVVNKLVNRRWVGGCGTARPRTILATISSHDHLADKLSGPELKSGVWVGYTTK